MQHTTLTLLHYTGLSNRAWAFAQMGLAFQRMGRVEGLRFARLLGSGAGNGFGLAPNFGVYAFLGHWENAQAAGAFRRENDWWQQVRARTSDRLTVRMQATMTHGEWAGQRPFPDDRDAYDPTGPVAVITRATIKTRKLLDFWRYVPRTSASVYDHSERLLSVGVGEYPVFMQATFSLWTNGKAMQEFAYRTDHHREVVKLTRERGWYKEEMFTRFKVLGTEGNWPGIDLKLLKL